MGYSMGYGRSAEVKRLMRWYWLSGVEHPRDGHLPAHHIAAGRAGDSVEHRPLFAAEPYDATPSKI